jgi:PAS domain S-box-containing protein
MTDPQNHSKPSRLSSLGMRVIVPAVVFLIIAAALIGVTTNRISALDRATTDARSAGDTVAAADRLERSVIDLETGQRGFAITLQDRFLQPWRDGLHQIPGELALLRDLTSESPAESSKAGQIDALLSSYITNYSKPTVATLRRDPEAGRSIIRTGEGKQRVDAMRKLFDQLVALGHARANDAVASADSGRRTVYGLLLGGLLLLGALTVLLAIYLRRSVVRPIRAVSATASTLQTDLSARVPEAGSRETAELAASFNAMAASLQRAQEELTSLLESTAEGIYGTDMKGLCTFINPAGARMLGYERRELLGEHLHTLIHHTRPDGTPYPARECKIYRAFERGMAVTADDEVFWRKGGMAVPVEYTSQPVSVDGEIRGAVVSFSDITARLEREEQRQRLLEYERQQSARLRELDQLKDEFVSLVSHELRTPLTSVIGYLELLSEGEGGELPEDARHFLEVAERNARRLLTLVGELLMIARIEAGKLDLRLERVALRPLVAEAVDSARPAAETKGLELTLEDGSDTVVEADRERLGQILDNLVSNAIKFTPSGGRVDVAVAERNGSVAVSVSDTGIGIAESEREHMFQRFFRTKGAAEHAIQGTGLGLTITKALVEAHHGTISFESAENEGSTFTVQFPVARKETD